MSILYRNSKMYITYLYMNNLDSLLYANVMAGRIFNTSYLALDKAMEFYSDGSDDSADACDRADLNHDGQIDGADLGFFLGNCAMFFTFKITR